MSSTDSGPVGGRRPSRREPEQGTDPGRSQPYESLYRDPDGVVPESHRTTARHYEPSLSPPDEQPAGDTYHWLYRPEPEPSKDPDDELDSGRGTAGEAALDRPPTEATKPPGANEATSVAALRDVPPPQPAEELRPDAGHLSRGAEPGTPRRRVWPVILLALLLVAAGAVIVLTIGERGSPWTSSDPETTQRADNPEGQQGSANPGDSPAATDPSASSSSTDSRNPGPTSSASSESYSGGVLPVATSRVVADCQAPPSTDGEGKSVRYDANQLTDGDVTTAWRCVGDGSGRGVVFSFAAGTRIAELGLINGYTKIDPKTRADRYGEYRRILAVKWTFPNGLTFAQALKDDDRAPQKLRIPVQTADEVRLTIVKASKPGGRAESRDAVLMSEATFGTPDS